MEWIVKFLAWSVDRSDERRKKYQVLGKERVKKYKRQITIITTYTMCTLNLKANN